MSIPNFMTHVSKHINLYVLVFVYVYFELRLYKSRTIYTLFFSSRFIYKLVYYNILYDALWQF